MLNVLVPMSGPMPFFSEGEYPFPKPLVEISGLPMIEYSVRNILECGPDVHVNFLVREDYCNKYHLDDTIRLLAPSRSQVTKVATETRGALCTALLAVEQIDNDHPLLIVNFDQYFTHGFAEKVARLFEPPYEGGCLVFESVHPRWSFVRTGGGEIVEAAEKRPITKRAIAGVYGFGRGSDFVKAAKQALLKDASHDEIFYLSAAVNEMVLMNKRLRAVEVPTKDYHSFYSPKKIAEFAGSEA